MSQPLKLRWVLAHIPYDLFLRSANAFAKAINEKTNGQIEVEILGKDEWEKKYTNGVEISNFKIMKLLEAGAFEMSQMYSTLLGQLSSDYYVLDMPFLFENHDHATRVLDGSIGKDLLKGLGDKSNAHGLAFTYSGGYKMIAANKPISNIADLKDVHLRCGHSPVSKATFETIGATTEALGVDGFADAVARQQVEAGENVFPRYFRSNVDKVTNTVANTEHALFLTSIVINKKLWNEVLTQEQRDIIQECAQLAAVEERKESLIDGAAALERAKAEGKQVVEWSDEAVSEFKEAVKPVYEQFESFFSDKDLVNRIKNA
jgi:TRAP-type C4-dicarboxylate transport system substrate-binding protein